MAQALMPACRRLDDCPPRRLCLEVPHQLRPQRRHRRSDRQQLVLGRSAARARGGVSTRERGGDGNPAYDCGTTQALGIGSCLSDGRVLTTWVCRRDGRVAVSTAGSARLSLCVVEAPKVGLGVCSPRRYEPRQRRRLGRLSNLDSRSRRPPPFWPSRWSPAPTGPARSRRSQTREPNTRRRRALA